MFVLTSASKTKATRLGCPARAAGENTGRAHSRSTAGTNATEAKAHRAAEQSDCKPQATQATGHNRKRVTSSKLRRATKEQKQDSHATKSSLRNEIRTPEAK